jgi:hypothetical protein
MRRFLVLLIVVAVASLSACATVPTGPSVMVLPGDSKSFEQFRFDDAACRQFAYEQAGGVSGQQAAQNSAVSSAVVGTAIGAAAGAAIGAAAGNAGAGAAIGAGSGLLFGSAAGSGYASGSYYEAQRRYDNAYLQCMYAKGNQIPGYRRTVRSTSPPPRNSSYPPPSRGYQPPPADYPPPPPDYDEH